MSMNRRLFLQSMAAGTAAMHSMASAAEPAKAPEIPRSRLRGASSNPSIDGHTELSRFTLDGEQWTVYEDLRTRDGVITFLSASGSARVLPKTAEAVFPEPGPEHLGLKMSDIGMSGPDLLAEKLLANGEPDEAEVRRAAPPMNSRHPKRRYFRPRWNTILGTRECDDTMPVYPAGNTRTYHPIQYFPELTNDLAWKRHEGLIGGWMPAVRKVFPGDNGSHYETIAFGDVMAHDEFIVQTWHRTAHFRDGKIVKVVYGYSYPKYGPTHLAPAPAEFYRGLLQFAEYWDRQIHEMSPLTLPETSWSDMAQYAFVKEQLVRPGGVYPKYGAVDRDYYGPEYDGFQDIFTMSLYANLECGRFTQARQVFDEFFTHFVNEKGVNNMRGPETAQFGLTLFLIARYYLYTRDASLLRRHREKIEATAALLSDLHDQSLKLPETDRGYGLIHGWCESDSCLTLDPSIWWKPYFANSAFAVRGWRDLAPVWHKLGLNNAKADDWLRRSHQLRATLVKSVAANIRHDMQPPYIGPLPGTKLTFRESMVQEHPSEQKWAHRCYAELLEAAVLPDDQTTTVIDCMRAYGVTTLGVVANVMPPRPQARNILGFISYGYAQALLQMDRIDEYILFMYSHRYHDHSRGSWTAGEVTGINGGGALFCIPAQQTIPILVRWMLVFEDPDLDRLYLGRAVPRKWFASPEPVGIEQAPTRWGRVNYRVEKHGQDKNGNDRLTATVDLPAQGEIPAELHVSFRAPKGKSLATLTVNGHPVTPAGRHKDAALFPTKGKRKFVVEATLS